MVQVLLAVMLGLVGWTPSLDPGVASYGLSLQHLEAVWGICVDEDDPTVTWDCVIGYVRHPGESWTVGAAGCGERCEVPGAVVPELAVGDVLFFKLWAERLTGCESLTAWPPAGGGSGVESVQSNPGVAGGLRAPGRRRVP